MNRAAAAADKINKTKARGTPEFPKEDTAPAAAAPPPAPMKVSAPVATVKLENPVTRDTTPAVTRTPVPAAPRRLEEPTEVKEGASAPDRCAGDADETKTPVKVKAPARSAAPIT